MIDEHIVIDEHGACACTGCFGLFRRTRDGEGLMVLICTHCAVAFEASHLEEKVTVPKARRKAR